MTKRAKLITALVAAIALVVVTPLAAVAYWVVTTQLTATAQASTFSIAAYSISPAPAGSSTSFTGWSGTRYFAAPLTNDGQTPWSGRTVTVAAGSGLGSAAVATVQVVFAADASACQTDPTYGAAAAPQSALAASTWTSTAAVAPGTTTYACIKLAVTDTDTRTPSGQPAPAPTLTVAITAKAAQGNWTDQEGSSLTASSTGWAECTSSGSTATLTFAAAVQPGKYTIERHDTGATFSSNVAGNARTTLPLTNPASSGTENAETYVTVTNSSGTVTAVARLSFRSSGSGSGFTKSLACA